MPRRWAATFCLLAALCGSATAAPWGDAPEAGATLETAAAPVAPEAAPPADDLDPDTESPPVAPIFMCNSSDPLVMLDEAKQSIGEGKLRRAVDMLAMISPDPQEPYVAEELLFQRLLLAGAFLNAAGAVLRDAQAAEYGDSSYADWLRGEAARYGNEYSALAQEYLAALAGGQDCDFVRFRLPRVTAEHLQDAVLYSDPQVLRAAVENWDDERTGLGKGLIGTQARVALVLGAAAFYDLGQSSATLEGVALRLRNGVPLDLRTALDWIAQTAADQSPAAGSALQAVQSAADARLAALLTQPGSVLKLRYDKRNGLAPAPPAKTKGGKAKSNGKRS